jgi:hypothetical protein
MHFMNEKTFLFKYGGMFQTTQDLINVDYKNIKSYIKTHLCKYGTSGIFSLV